MVRMLHSGSQQIMAQLLRSDKESIHLHLLIGPFGLMKI